MGRPHPRRLRIHNGCEREPIWIAHEAGADIGPDAQNIKILPGSEYHFATPPGLSATRYWPKMGCDEDGNHCNLGNSGGPGQLCVRRPPEVKEDDYSNCAPPIDSKFEGTFDNGGWDFVDMSLVDGWTLPFKLTLSGGECSGQGGTYSSTTIDCSGLTFDLCPKGEVLSAAGITVDLRAVNPHTKEITGCYAPCQLLVSGKWNNTVSKGRHHDDPEVSPYCCPTPPETPESCRQGPITQTAFLSAVHEKCQGVYGYAYDDGMGLLQCTPSSIYDLTFFCPDAKTDGSTITRTASTTTETVTSTTNETTITTTKAAAPWSHQPSHHQSHHSEFELLDKSHGRSSPSDDEEIVARYDAKGESSADVRLWVSSPQQALSRAAAAALCSFAALAVATLARRRPWRRSAQAVPERDGLPTQPAPQAHRAPDELSALL